MLAKRKILGKNNLKWFKLFPFAKKFVLCTHFLFFFSSVAMLCIKKKTSIGHKILNFRLNAKNLNHFFLLKQFLIFFFIKFINRKRFESRCINRQLVATFVLFVVVVSFYPFEFDLMFAKNCQKTFP